MVTKVLNIPFDPVAQKFGIALNGTNYNLRSVWNDVSQCWIVDIADSDDIALVSGVAIVTGDDLLAQFEYLGIGGGLIATTDAVTDEVPTYANLGTSGHVYFVVP